MYNDYTVSGMRHLARYWSQASEILPPAGVGSTKWRIPFIKELMLAGIGSFVFPVIKNTMENKECQSYSGEVEKYSEELGFLE